MPEPNYRAMVAQYAAKLAASKDNLKAWADIEPPDIGPVQYTSHTPFTENGRVREEAGIQQIVKAVALLPVQPATFVNHLRGAAAELLVLAELEYERPGRLLAFFDKYTQTLSDFIKFGNEVVVAFWLHWNHVDWHKHLTGYNDPEGARLAGIAAFQAEITKMRQFLEKVRDRRGPLNPLESTHRTLLGFLGEMRRAAMVPFEIELHQIPRFLHLEPKYQVYNLNLPNFNYIRILDADGNAQKVPPPPPAYEFMPNAYQYNVPVGIGSGKMTGPQHPQTAPTNQYHAVPHHHLQPPYPYYPNQPTYNTGQPIHHSFSVTVSPPSITQADREKRAREEASVPWESFIGDLQRKSEENRVQAMAAPLPKVRLNKEGNLKVSNPYMYRSAAGYAESDDDDADAGHRRGNRPRAISLDNRLVVSSGDKDSERKSRRRSEHLSSDYVPDKCGDGRGTDNEGEKVRKSSKSRAGSEQRTSRKSREGASSDGGLSGGGRSAKSSERRSKGDARD